MTEPPAGTQSSAPGASSIFPARSFDCEHEKPLGRKCERTKRLTGQEGVCIYLHAAHGVSTAEVQNCVHVSHLEPGNPPIE